MTEHWPVIVVGAGHNGLACAALLARAGRKVLVLEAAAQPGGAAVTRELAPGYRVSAVAHLLHLLDPALASELALSRYGLRLAASGLHTVALSGTAPPIVIDGAEIRRGEVSVADRAAFAALMPRLARFARLIARQHGRVPPRLAFGSWREALPALSLALDVRRLGQQDMREFLRIATMNVFDVLEEHLASPLLKGALALDGVLGTRLGPRSGNTVYAMLYRQSGCLGGLQGALGIPLGGMGAVTEALSAAACAAGVEIRCNAAVRSILVAEGRVAGVQLESGETIEAQTLVSNADPQATLLRLLGARHLEAGFAQRVHHIRAVGTAAKLHLALGALPQFAGVTAAELGQRLVIAPDLGYIERAFNPVKYRGFSQEPILEITIPTVHDTTLAPAGRHVLSAIVQYAPYDLAGGWGQGRQPLMNAIMAVLERHAPGLGNLVEHAELLTPADIESQFRITGGHWHHGELTLDQIMMLRPVPGAAQYLTPVPGLYLCSAGCHPGGGVMGSAGRNAARVVLGQG